MPRESAQVGEEPEARAGLERFLHEPLHRAQAEVDGMPRTVTPTELDDVVRAADRLHVGCDGTVSPPGAAPAVLAPEPREDLEMALQARALLA